MKYLVRQWIHGLRCDVFSALAYVLPDTEEIIDGVRVVDSVVPQISEEITDRVHLVGGGSSVPQITEEMGGARAGSYAGAWYPRASDR